MTSGPVRAPAGWLRLREPADAAARSGELVDELRSSLAAPGATSGPLVVHDLGCGSGSMARWLAPRLPGAQHWVMHDRDLDLLGLVAADPPTVGSDGSPVTWEVRSDDITRLTDLGDAGLVTASALLDMFTQPELQRLVDTVAAASCSALIALSVVGRVELTPGDPLDRRVAEAFNDHQRRVTGSGRLLGPEAFAAAVDQFGDRGFDVEVRDSPWRLGPEHAALAEEWFVGWLGAACDQQPELRHEAALYERRRLEEARAGRLSVTVHHADLLARPRRAPAALRRRE
jgi:hypothetical protein